MTKIEWTDATWNPVVGCSNVSPGCDHCYAASVAARQMQPAHEGLTVGREWNGTVRLLPDRLDEPLRWRKPRRVFVCSMSDLFHPDVPAEFVGRAWSTMSRCQQHTFQILTKRPQRMAKVLGPEGCGWYAVEGPVPFPEPNVWLGTSIESDRYAFRADHLRATPAAVRFLSLEPLLGPLPSLDLAGIDWVIVGGESGPGARPMHPGWVRDIRDRCIDAGVPFFFKQWGAWEHRPEKTPMDVYEVRKVDGQPETVRKRSAARSNLTVVEPAWATGAWSPKNAVMQKVGKREAGRVLDGRTWDEFPSTQTVPGGVL